MKTDKKERDNTKKRKRGLFGKRHRSSSAGSAKSIIDSFVDKRADSMEDTMALSRQNAFYGNSGGAAFGAPANTNTAAATPDVRGALVAHPGNVSAAVNKASGASWNTDEELEALLRASSTVIEEVAAEEAPEEVTTADVAVAAYEAQPAAEVPAEDEGDKASELSFTDEEASEESSSKGAEDKEEKWSEFYEGLEDMFRTE